MAVSRDTSWRRLMGGRASRSPYCRSPPCQARTVPARLVLDPAAGRLVALRERRITVRAWAGRIRPAIREVWIWRTRHLSLGACPPSAEPGRRRQERQLGIGVKFGRGHFGLLIGRSDHGCLNSLSAAGLCQDHRSAAGPRRRHHLRTFLRSRVFRLAALSGRLGAGGGRRDRPTGVDRVTHHEP